MRALGVLLLAGLLAPTAAAGGTVRLAFALVESESVFEGDLAPGQAVAYDVPLAEPNLTRATFTLDWTGTGDPTGLSGAETFSLAVADPAGAPAGSTQGAQGALSVTAGANALPASVVVPASEAPARIAAATAHAGQGVWRSTLRMENAGGALDRGNHYRLTIRAWRYEAVPLQPATGGPDYGTMANDPARVPLGWQGAAAVFALVACTLAAAALARIARRRRAPDDAPALPAGDNTVSEKR